MKVLEFKLFRSVASASLCLCRISKGIYGDVEVRAGKEKRKQAQNLSQEGVSAQ